MRAANPVNPANNKKRRATPWSLWSLWRPWASAAALLLVWFVLDVAGLLNERILPGPGPILEAAWRLIGDGQLGQALAASLPRVMLGTVAGVAAGISLGFVSGFWRLGEDLIDRPLQMLRAIPFTALVPLFILWFGIDERPKIMLVFVGAIVPIYVNTAAGVKNVDAKLVELGLVYGAPWETIARRIILPGALPQILTGLRYGLATAWVALVVAETVATNQGIGFLLANARQYGQTDVVILCIVIYALLGVITDQIVRWLEAHLLRWRPATQR